MKQFIYLLSFFIFYSCAGNNSTPEYRTATTALRSDKNPEKAEKAALAAIELYPNNPLAAFFLASEIYSQPNSRLKNFEKAAKYYDLAIKIDNQDGDDDKLESPKIIDGTKIETIKQGVSYYSKVLRIDLYNLAMDYISTGENIKAEKSLLLASSLITNDAQSYQKLALIYYDIQNYSDALTYANKSLEIDKNISMMYWVKGSIESQSGDKIKAEELLSKAYDLSLKNEESPAVKTLLMSKLFEILFQNEKKAQALELSEKLIESDPTNIDLYNNAGAVYQNLFLEKQTENANLFKNLNNLSESDLEQLKTAYEDCIQLAQQSRENFLMCSELELNEIKSESYYDQSKKLKYAINDIKRIIKKINKKLDES